MCEVPASVHDYGVCAEHIEPAYSQVHVPAPASIACPSCESPIPLTVIGQRKATCFHCHWRVRLNGMGVAVALKAPIVRHRRELRSGY